MQLLDKLRHHAKMNVWCSPFQDHQAILKLSRLTQFGGARHFLKIHWSQVKLPDDSSFFHVYQIGQNCPLDLGLFPQRGFWIKLSDLGTETGLLSNVYNKDGIQYPLSETWICRNGDKNFLLACRELPKTAKSKGAEKYRIINLDKEEIFLRLYSNAYFSSLRATTEASDFTINGITVRNTQDINTLQNQLADYVNKEGYLMLFKNGRLTDDISAANVEIGDNIEYVFDSTVETYIDFPVSELEGFRSNLDKLEKYLIHPPKRGDNEIWFVDDVDIYLYKKLPGKQLEGVYYHRNKDESLRMITHRDYSAPTAFISGYTRNNDEWGNNDQGLVLRLILRKSGYSRPLVFENNRIHELYKLNDTKIVRALQGLDGVVEEWKAANLESAWYTYIMRCWEPEITGLKVKEAYGYNAISKLVADSPIKVIAHPDGHKYAPLGWGLHEQCTVYEYDDQGLLLGYYIHLSGDIYFTRNADCELIEPIMGYGTNQPNVWYGPDDRPLDTNVGYRFYLSKVVDGDTQHDWREIASSEGLYEITDDGVLKWHYNRIREVGVMKGDDRFLADTIFIDNPDGLYRFHIKYTDLQGIPMDLPVGKIELWLNGRSLIENIDFYIDWPEVILVNKEWLNETGSNRIDIRATEWCTKDGKLQPPEEYGFVDHGLLSLNEVYNLRDDKVIRCVADGRTFHRDDLIFAEQRYGLRVKGDLEEGRPYWITPVRVPIRGLHKYDTDSERLKAEEIDKRVGDYISVQMKEPTFDLPESIKRRYRVFSPFIAKLIYDINRGFFKPPKMPASDKVIMDGIQDYLPILNFDPTTKGVDFERMVIHPHPWWKTVYISQNTYAYLTRVINIYLADRVDLSQFVMIKG